MKIGIITFHWATNYGAVLQCYCLQEYLRDNGHEVNVINYKPENYDISLWKYIKKPIYFLSNFRKLILKLEKEHKLDLFRKEYLIQTKRYYSNKELEHISYDIVISGSDQILNPTFTLYGENGKPSSAYYLGFIKNKTRKMGYAVSFGCSEYPIEALNFANKWINNFDVIGVREDTGIGVLNQMDYKKNKYVVPDPTILYGKKLFSDLGVDIHDVKCDYTCVYMLRSEINVDGYVKIIDDIHTPLSMKQWLTTISQAKFMITNSYHGMIMAILSHVPFVVLLENNEYGMNDRFSTLLKRIGLENRMLYEYDSQFDYDPIDWNEVDNSLVSYCKNSTDILSLFLCTPKFEDSSTL